MKKILLIAIIYLSVLSCQPMDLYHAVDQYDYIVRLADLARAVVDENYTVDWDGLTRLSQKYEIDLRTPTWNFINASNDLRAAYRQLQGKIDAEYQNKNEVEALSRALRKLTQ